MTLAKETLHVSTTLAMSMTSPSSDLAVSMGLTKPIRYRTLLIPKLSDSELSDSELSDSELSDSEPI
jgi:hypothetical protein